METPRTLDKAFRSCIKKGGENHEQTAQGRAYYWSDSAHSTTNLKRAFILQPSGCEFACDDAGYVENISSQRYSVHLAVLRRTRSMGNLCLLKFVAYLGQFVRTKVNDIFAEKAEKRQAHALTT
ncbi:hypothetical protein PsorP6_016727 [Peronosclerospora sorghi]|uniref:Uncharacterized protein n=1 Tax=Peronosclerospora sorghi TaxID=230839 RepID=A0ACC0WBG5_9STRA|nr:hypothetical protein PsorP6_016727 [Peronosclerospora sorghi]